MTLKINFVTEEGTTFALAQNQMFKGKMYEELLFAEIEHDGKGGYYVRWEDDYNNKIACATVDGYKSLILNNLLSHKPHNNGVSYEMEE